MKKTVMALMLICALLIGGVCMAEESRVRLDAADRVVYQITNGKYRLMDFEGNIVGGDYDAFPEDAIGDVAVYLAHGRFGYISKTGQVLVEPNYLELPVFENGYAAVRMEDIDATERDPYSVGICFPNICGVIDAYGDVVVPMEYDYARLSGDGKYVIVDKSGEIMWSEGLYDLERQKIVFEPEFYSINDPHDGTVLVGKCFITPNENSNYGDNYTYKNGVLNLQGEELLPIEYDRIDYNEGFNAYTCYNNDKIVSIYEIVDGTLVERGK